MTSLPERRLTHLKQLEAESIQIIREVAAEFENPVMLYSVGKDSAVMLHLARKAFFPGKPPFPLMHVDTTWKFKEMISFRDKMAKEAGMDLLVHTNQEGVDMGVGPFTHGSSKHTDIMKTQALKQALDKYKFDAAFGGARRDEEKSRAKERVFSFRDKFHRWDPKSQRPELWTIFNTRVDKGESIRVFPLSNWTDLLYASITKFGGVFAYARKKLIEWRVVFLLLLGSIPGSLLTLEYLKGLDALEQIEHLMNLTLGFSLILTSIAVFCRNRIRTYAMKIQHEAWVIKAKRVRPAITVVMGIVLGGLVTLSSVGAGALGTALLITLYPRMNMPAIVGTDLVHAVVLTGVAGAGHYTMGSVDLSLLAYLLIGSLPGVFLGSHLGAKLSPALMQPIIGSVLLVIGVRFVLAG